MDITVNCLLRNFFRGLEQGSDINIETKIGESSSDNFGSPINLGGAN